MDTRDLYKLIRGMEENHESEDIKLHDSFDIELNENFVIETGVVGFTEDGGVILHLDEDALEFLGFHGVLNESEQVDEYMKLGGGGDAAEGGTRVMGEDLNETYTSEESPVYNAIINRITRQHLDLLSKYGPAAVMSAVEEVAHSVGGVDEIGSSDVSIWTRQAIEYLEAGHYDHLKEEDELKEIKRLAYGSKKTDCPVCHGTGGHDKLTVRDGHHTVPCRTCKGTGEVDSDEDNELDEGLGKMLLCGAALIAAITGINKYEANQMMKNDPQLAKLAHFREVAQQKGDEAKVQELDDRIKQTLGHLTVTGDEVRDEMGRPVDPQYESVEIDEAEYQGHKVTLNKPTSGDVKKSKVYVKKPNGKVVKVNFGDPNMRIKKNSPSHRKSFRARHHCENPGPKWKARYWSCKAW